MKNFPKLETIFVRKNIGKDYIVIDKINESCKWVFEEDDVFAVDKLDGTNIGIRIEKGNITKIFNRKNELFL